MIWICHTLRSGLTGITKTVEVSEAPVVRELATAGTAGTLVVLDQSVSVVPNGIDMPRSGEPHARTSTATKSSGKQPEMKTDVHALTIDMLRFGALPQSMKISGLAQEYAAKAMELRSDPSDQDVEEVREWVRLTLKGGSGGLGDLYVQKQDGSVDQFLNAQYEELLTYEVMTAPGVTRLVGLDQLGEAVGYGPQHSRMDWQECQMVAHRLFMEGHKDDWVHYSSSYVVPDETLRKVG